MEPEEVRHIRRRILGLTRKELAQKLNMSVHSVKAWEMDPESAVHRNPSGAVVILLNQWKNEYLTTGSIKKYAEQDIGR